METLSLLRELESAKLQTHGWLGTLRPYFAVKHTHIQRKLKNLCVCCFRTHSSDPLDLYVPLMSFCTFSVLGGVAEAHISGVNQYAYFATFCLGVCVLVVKGLASFACNENIALLDSLAISGNTLFYMALSRISVLVIGWRLLAPVFGLMASVFMRNTIRSVWRSDILENDALNKQRKVFLLVVMVLQFFIVIIS